MPAKRAPSKRSPKAWAGYRSKHRQRSHDEAHAEQQRAAPPPLLIDHPRVPAGEPEVITTQPELDALLDTLRRAGEVAYDTEFIGEQSYFPHLCLIQVATPDTVALIDPFAGIELEGFWRLLADPAITTVVHAGVQDLEPIFRHAQRPVGEVFDTQIAAGFAGMDYPVSLAGLVDQLIGGALEQGPKFSRWDQRPLSSLQKAYAANDVRYLMLVRDRVAGLVEERGNTAALREELQTTAEQSPQLGPPPLEKLKARGVSNLSRRRRTVLHELVAWRDSAARRLDMPPRSVVPDETLVTLACDDPSDAAELHNVPGLPRPVKEQFTDELLDTLHRARSMPAIPAPPRSRKPTPAQKERCDTLWQRVQQACDDRGIATAIACNRKEISGWALSPKRREELRERFTTGWRGDLLGPLMGELDRNGEIDVEPDDEAEK